MMQLRTLKSPSPEEISLALELRCRVFVDEQNVPIDEELDGLDEEAVHVVLLDDSGVARGTGRFLLQGQVAKIGRIAVDSSCRGQGVGRQVMEALESAARDAGARIARLDAQTAVIGFYERLGYFAYGDLHLDAGILHRWMDKALDLRDPPGRGPS